MKGVVIKKDTEINSKLKKKKEQEDKDEEIKAKAEMIRPLEKDLYLQKKVPTKVYQASALKSPSNRLLWMFYLVI